MEPLGLTLSPYFCILALLGFGLLLGGGVSALALFLGPKKPNAAKLQPYECGVPAISNASEKLSVKFYLVAIVFIVFDVETLFLFLWSRVFEQLQWFGMAEMGLFVLTLAVGLFYVLGHGVLKWGVLKSAGSQF